MVIPTTVATIPLIAFSPVFGIFSLAGYLQGSFIEPDLDQIGLSSSEGRAMRKFGIIGVFWVMFWMPYAYVIPHRSPFSHWPYLGSAIRLAYLLALPIFIAWWFGLFGLLEQFNKHELAWAIMGNINGMAWADSVHFFLDTKLYKRLEGWFHGRTKEHL